MSDRDDLALFARALRLEIEHDAAAHPPQLDVVDVVDRAMTLDAEAIPTGLRESLPVETEGVDRPDQPDRRLIPFTTALRARIMARARARELRPVELQSHTRYRVWVVAGVALAAAVLLVFALPGAGSWLVDERERELMGAERTLQPSDEGGSIRSRGPRTRPARTPAEAQPAQTQPAELLLPEIEPPRDEPASVPELAAEPRKPQHRARDLDRLEAEAHRRWQAGDLEGAERLLRQVIRRSGRSSRAELAYGDLFSIARQRGGVAAQAKVWRTYLRAFPRGRFADDARAGLCRREGETMRSTCWSEYLKMHPRGAHVTEARRAQTGE